MRKPLTPSNRKQPVIRPDAKRNARTKKISVIHGGGSTALKALPFDGRTRLFKAYQQHVTALEAHLGGDLTPPQARLVDQAARLALLAQLTWAEIERGGLFKNGELRPAVEAYRNATRDEREVLRLLGLKRHSKELTLSDYLSGRENPAMGPLVDPATVSNPEEDD
ncbi:MAG: hypothetical protein ABIK08_04540 [Pseudomonadota bacterium]